MTVDAGLLSPVSAGFDDVVGDHAVLAALVEAEVALTRAWGDVGVAPAEVVAAVDAALGSLADPAALIAPGELALRSVAGGNPVIPLVAVLRDAVAGDAAKWVHRGATSQDIVDSALMLVASRAVQAIDDRLTAALASLAAFAAQHAETACAARTLTQHAVPTTWGARAAGWMRGIERAQERLRDVAGQGVLPAQLGGAAATLSAFVEQSDADNAAALPAAFAARLGLATSSAPWHTQRWPITELGDALVQALDALGKFATDVAGAARTEVGELLVAAGGGSSAMPQKQNPVQAVLIRSAAMRAPMLGATLHQASAFAVDERPDGAWHAEWPTLRELCRITLGAAAHAADLAAGIRLDEGAVARVLAATGGLIVSERLGIALRPRIGAARFQALIAAASAGGSLRELVEALPEAGDLDLDALLDPGQATGLASRLAAVTATSTTASNSTHDAQQPEGFCS